MFQPSRNLSEYSRSHGSKAGPPASLRIQLSYEYDRERSSPPVRASRNTLIFVLLVFRGGNANVRRLRVVP